MSKKKHQNKRHWRKQPGQPSVEVIQNLDDIFALFAKRRIHATVRPDEDGKEALYAGSFDSKRPLPASFYLVAAPHMEELTELVKRSDPRVCIDPTMHEDAIRTDGEGRRFCQQCRTYRSVSEKLRAQRKAK